MGVVLVSWLGSRWGSAKMSDTSRRSRTVLLAIALLCAGAGLGLRAATAAARSDSQRALSAQELAELRSGRLVTRPEQRLLGNGRLIGGLAWQRVSAAPERVWRALDDVANYPHFLPAVREAKLVQQVGSESRVFIHHHIGVVDASYFVMTAKDLPQNRFRFHLDRQRPSSLRDAWGELYVTPSEDGGSVLSFAIMVDLGSGVLEALVRPSVHEWMLRIPSELKRYVEHQRV